MKSYKTKLATLSLDNDVFPTLIHLLGEKGKEEQSVTCDSIYKYKIFTEIIVTLYLVTYFLLKLHPNKYIGCSNFQQLRVWYIY